MKLSIIVTHYDEPFEIVKPLLDSIDMQLGVNWKDVEVIIVQDKPDCNIDEELFHEYPYQFVTNIIGGEHIGVSGARNLGLDEAQGEYVMFCDCDDRFISAYALHLFFKQMGKFDIIKSPFIEDQIIDGELKLIRHDHDISFIHGKVFRRQFLIDNELRFNEKLTIHEDGFFNVLTNIIAGANQYEMQPAVYLWKYNEKSVVRRDRNLFLYKTYSNLMDCRIAICEELEKRGYITEFLQAVAKTVIDSYYDFQKPKSLDPENEEIIKSAEKEFARYYKQFRQTYNELNINDVSQMMFLCRNTAYMNELRVEQETLSQFLTRVVKEYNI